MYPHIKSKKKISAKRSRSTKSPGKFFASLSRVAFSKNIHVKLCIYIIYNWTIHNAHSFWWLCTYNAEYAQWNPYSTPDPVCIIFFFSFLFFVFISNRQKSPIQLNHKTVMTDRQHRNCVSVPHVSCQIRIECAREIAGFERTHKPKIPCVCSQTIDLVVRWVYFSLAHSLSVSLSRGICNIDMIRI